MTTVVWQMILTLDVVTDDYYGPRNISFPQSCHSAWVGELFRSSMQKLTFTLEQWNSTKDDVGMTPIPVWIRVTSSSMMPLIRPFRDDVMVVSLRHNDLKVGDIVLYSGKFLGGDYCLHRLHRIEGNRVQTFGDGNLKPDDWMPHTCIMGKAVIIRRGWLTINCESPRWQQLFRLWQRLLPFRPLLLLPFSAMNKFYRTTTHKSVPK